MMKLKYLFDNRDLTEMILKNWEYDADKLDLFNYFRISANAVYPFSLNGEMHILRFSPVEERSADTILAELEFLKFLRNEGYPANHTLLSRTGNELEYVETPWGGYYAVVFKRVPGNKLREVNLTDGVIAGFGKVLGELHRGLRGGRRRHRPGRGRTPGHRRVRPPRAVRQRGIDPEPHGRRAEEPGQLEVHPEGRQPPRLRRRVSLPALPADPPGPRRRGRPATSSRHAR